FGNGECPYLCDLLDVQVPFVVFALVERGGSGHSFDSVAALIFPREIRGLNRLPIHYRSTLLTEAARRQALPIPPSLATCPTLSGRQHENIDPLPLDHEKGVIGTILVVKAAADSGIPELPDGVRLLADCGS